MRIELQKMGVEIRKRRELLGLLQPQLAAISNVSRRTIQLIESGKGNPSVETLIQIIDPLGFQIKLLIKETSS